MEATNESPSYKLVTELSILDDFEVQHGGSSSSRSSSRISRSSSRIDSSSSSSSKWWRWIKITTIVLLAILGPVLFGILVLPLLLDKVVIPTLVWVASRFRKPELALLLVASLALFPVVLIPSGPSMWLSGMIFGYGIGFCIIMAGTTVGQSLPYFVGRFLLHDRIQTWLERWPRKAMVLRAAETGSWFHKFRMVALLRVAPIPYTLFNYAIAATHIEYWPYIAGSVAGMVPEAFITIYSGRLLRSLAEAKHAKRSMNTAEIVYNVLGFCVAVGGIFCLTMYGRRALARMEMESKSSSAIADPEQAAAAASSVELVLRR